VIFNVPTIVPSLYSGAGGYYEIYAPAGTYHINVWPPFDGNYISYDEPTFTVTTDVSNKNLTLGIGYKVSGYITDASGAPVVGACVFYGSYGSGWFSNSAGYYFLSAPAGTYTITARPRSGYNYQSPTTNFTTYNEYNVLVNSTLNKNITVQLVNSTTTPTATPALTPGPSGGTEIFRIESNSSWSNLYFNSTTVTLTFTVSGENGTTGYTKAYIAKTLVPTFTGASVSLDGKSTNFTVTDTAEYWVLEFTYHHSTHIVAIDLANDSQVDTNLLPSQSPADMSTIPEFTPFAFVGVLVLASVALALTRKKISQPLTRRV